MRIACDTLSAASNVKSTLTGTRRRQKSCDPYIARGLFIPGGLTAQFASQQLRNLCAEVGIKQVFASVEHPQTNGQV